METPGIWFLKKPGHPVYKIILVHIIIEATLAISFVLKYYVAAKGAFLAFLSIYYCDLTEAGCSKSKTRVAVNEIAPEK